MSPPLTLQEIRNFMLENGGKVTNHDLVKHFKETLTHPDSQNEARKQFKTFVNMLATIKAEDKGNGKMEKFLILKPKYVYELPSPDDSSLSMNASFPMSPSNRTLNDSDAMALGSPSRLPPPPYRAPPEVSTPTSSNPIKLPQLEQETETRFKDCVDEFQAAVSALRHPNPVFETPPSTPLHRMNSQDGEVPAPAIPPRKRSNASLDQVVTPPADTPTGRPSAIYAAENESLYDSGTMRSITGEMVVQEMYDLAKSESESKMSVKEATKRFNRIASEEEKTATPSPKRLAEKKTPTDTSNDALNIDMSHPKAREWIVSAARANYQELSKLAHEDPLLVKLQDPTNGFTALHWAAKHGNENVVKLIAGTYKADVNARTNGGYTPLHIAMQFGKDDIFELLQNVYNANRDLTDWSGKKPLDYRRTKTSVSATTYSSEYLAMNDPYNRSQSILDNREHHGRESTAGFLFSLTYPRRKGNSVGPQFGRELHEKFLAELKIDDERQKRLSRRTRPKTRKTLNPVPSEDTASLSSNDKSSGDTAGGGQPLSRRDRTNQSFLRKKFGSMGKKSTMHKKNRSSMH